LHLDFAIVTTLEGVRHFDAKPLHDAVLWLLELTMVTTQQRNNATTQQRNNATTQQRNNATTQIFLLRGVVDGSVASGL
jgi:hypothetical protein